MLFTDSSNMSTPSASLTSTLETNHPCCYFVLSSETVQLTPDLHAATTLLFVFRLVASLC